MPLSSGSGWCTALAAHPDSHGSWQYKSAELKSLEQARKDPVVQHHLAADLELYHAAKEAAAAQRKQLFGGAPKRVPEAV